MGGQQRQQLPQRGGKVGRGGYQNQNNQQQSYQQQQQQRGNEKQQISRGDGWAANQARWEEERKAREEAVADTSAQEQTMEDVVEELSGVDEALARVDPRDLLADLMMSKQNGELPSFRARLRGMAPLLPRSSAVLRGTKKLGILDGGLREPEQVVVLDANTEWDLRRKVAGQRRLGRVEFTGMVGSLCTSLRSRFI